MPSRFGRVMSMSKIQQIWGAPDHTDGKKVSQSSSAPDNKAAKPLGSVPTNTTTLPRITGSDSPKCRADCPLKLLWNSSLQFAACSPRLPEAPELLALPVALRGESLNADAIYRPLRKSGSTRLVELLPGKYKVDPLVCHLIEVDIIDGQGVGDSETGRSLHYEALSYTWGSSVSKFFIHCNGVQYAITENLAVVLHRLRDDTVSRFLWCDAICINQADNEEKAFQVRNMLRIFEKADHVIAWIGPQSNTTKDLFAFLSNDACWGALQSVDDHDNDCHEVLEILGTALEQLLQRPWFRRTWVRQEVFAAKRMTIVCGPHAIEFKTFVDRATRWAQITQSSDLPWSPTKTSQAPILLPRTINVIQKEFQHAGVDCYDYKTIPSKRRFTAHWFDVLNAGTSFEVTDPRDRIYGTLGVLRSPTTRLYVERRDEHKKAEAGYDISYSKSISEIYQYVVKFLINTDRTLDVLQIFEDRRSPADDLPSWTIDWRKPTKRIGIAPSARFGPGFRGLLIEQDYKDLGTLQLRGTRVGTPVRILDATSRKGTKVLFPFAETMDQGYPDMLHSECYILGNLDIAGERYRFVVPRTAMVDDVVVSFENSHCFHLLRPQTSPDLPQCYRFIGAVAQELPAIQNQLDAMRRSKNPTEIFLLR